jgi:hypothetical protein
VDKLLAAGLPVDAGQIDPAQMINLMVGDGLRGTNPLWRSHWVATGRRLVVELAGGEGLESPRPATLPPRRFTVSIRRDYCLKSVRPDTLVRLNLPMPIEDAHLEKLEIRSASPSLRPGIGRLQARLKREASEQVSIEAVYTFVARPGLPHGTETPPRPNAGCVLPAIRALARSIIGPESDPLSQVGALYDYLIDHMACGMVRGRPLSLDHAVAQVLATGWMDCRTGAALLVALCQSLGIAARLVGGWLLWDAPTEHYWMEAWVEGQGWTPFDLLAWDLSAGGMDAGWRGIFAGAVDYRMKTQVFPDLFTGPPGVPFPARWHRLSRMVPGGAETRMIAAPDGALIYSDRVTHITA